MRVLCCGSREWRDHDAIGERIAQLSDDALVIHGGARGADSHAAGYALGRGLFTARVDCLAPHYERFGQRAPLERNSAMLDLVPDLVIAFNLGTPGTDFTISHARRRGIPVEVIRP